MPPYNPRMKYTPKLVNLTKKQASILRNTSKHSGRPVSWLIRIAVDQWIENRQREIKAVETLNTHGRLGE